MTTEGSAILPEKNSDTGIDNYGYARHMTDSQTSTQNEGMNSNLRNPARTHSSSNSFPVIYETSSDDPGAGKPEISFAKYASSSAASLPHHQSGRHPNQHGHTERNLSILDPMSDRVSTILAWKNLSVQARESKVKEIIGYVKSHKKFTPQRKYLLHDTTGAITGGLWAVMGPSGSGKSTLLNTLACRLDVNTIVQGEMRLNGAPYDNAELKRIAGYVMQDDLLNGYLTVRETLMYTAKLRLDRSFTNKECQERVEDVMADLGLSHVHDVIVGTPLKKGISGGERKRVCVGMQLLNRPQLLFLDEPTSGLDSVTALDLLRTFHMLAHGKSESKAVTIVCSIHQPQAKIFNLFDSLILLKGGMIMYQGPRRLAMEVYRAAGFPCPVHANPADHLLDVITPPRSNPIVGITAMSIEQQSAIDDAILKAQTPIDVDLNMGVNKRLGQMANLPKSPSWPRQVQILFERTMQEQFRQLRIFITSLVQTVIISILIGTVFLQIGTEKQSILLRESALFFCVVNQGIFGALMVINSFPVERALSLRERASGTYFASAYFISKILAETVVQLPIPIIFSCIVYFLIGFQPNVGNFFVFMVFMLLCSVASTSLALMVSALCKTTELSVTVLPLALEVTRLFGGFFLSPKLLPSYFVWLDAISYAKYTFVGICLNELQDLKITCPLNDTTPGICYPTGEDIIRLKGYNYISIGGCIGVLIGYILVCRFIAFLGIRFLKH